jgi:predicted nucleic acid-binding protein
VVPVSIEMPSYFFDASAIVKLVVAEPGSRRVKELLGECGMADTSWVLLAEALNVLKRKWSEQRLSHHEYRESVLALFVLIESGALQPFDLETRNGRAQLITYDSVVFSHAEQFPHLDVADLLQLALISESFLRHLSGKSRAQLVTADQGLERAANSLGIPVLMVMNDLGP